MREEELKLLLLALAYECSRNKRSLCDIAPPKPGPPPSPPKPPCPPKPPKPPPPEPCPVPPDCAAAQVIGSIALEEAALAHIMNAEGEKIQHALANTTDVDKMLEVNASVAEVLRIVERLEQSLLAKLELAMRGVRKGGGGGKEACRDDDSPG